MGVCVCVFKTGHRTVAVTFVEFPVIRLTSGQASVSGSVSRIIMELSAVLCWSQWAISCVFLCIYFQENVLTTEIPITPLPYQEAPLWGPVSSNINPHFSCQPLRLRLSSSVLAKKNADTDMTLALPISSYASISPRCTIPSPFPTNTQCLQSQPHRVCLYQ